MSGRQSKYMRLKQELEVVRYQHAALGRLLSEARRQRDDAVGWLGDVAEMQREACAKEARFYIGLGWSGEHVAQQVRSVPLVTDSKQAQELIRGFKGEA